MQTAFMPCLKKSTSCHQSVFPMLGFAAECLPPGLPYRDEGPVHGPVRKSHLKCLLGIIEL